MNIDIGCSDVGVTESRRNSFYIATVSKKHGRTCVAKPVELEMTNTMALQKMVKLLRRRLRIHHVAILLGEHVVEIPPNIAEVGDMPILLQTVFRERFAEPFRNGYRANTALGLGFLLTSFTVAELINTTLDGYTLAFKINVCSLQANDLAAPTACEQRNLDHSADVPRLAFQGSEDVCDLLKCERLDFLGFFLGEFNAP